LLSSRRFETKTLVLRTTSLVPEWMNHAHCFNYTMLNSLYQPLTVKPAGVGRSAVYCSDLPSAMVRNRHSSFCRTTTATASGFGQPVWHQVAGQLSAALSAHWSDFFTSLSHCLMYATPVLPLQLHIYYNSDQESIINWNFLPKNVDFSTLTSFRSSIQTVDFTQLLRCVLQCKCLNCQCAFNV